MKTSEPLDELIDGFSREFISVPNSRMNDVLPTECRDLRSLTAEIYEVVTNEHAVHGCIAAGWGHFGSGQAVMPGQGRVVERPFTPEERAAMGDAVSTLGDTTFDVYLNDRAYWRNVPANVWSYKLGGYQVLKKWLSYRERKVLGRSLLPDEVQHFAEVGRRVSAILGLVTQSQ